MPDVARRVIGCYEILRELGRGGMSTVYLARQTDRDRCVALKELHAAGVWDPSFRWRMLREARVAGALSHPNIVTVFDCFERDGTPYVAMEYAERGSLRPYVGRMTLAQIGGVLEGLLAGLRHAEAYRIVHGDLKPENLLVTADGRVKIADFGLARATAATQTAASLTVTSVTAGRPAYMAPEQAMARDIGAWTDLYSVGCIAFELFTGRTPFDGSEEAPMATLLRQVNEPIPPVKSLVPEVDARISDWIERLLVKQPAWRTQHADEARSALEEILVCLLGPLLAPGCAGRRAARAPGEGDPGRRDERRRGARDAAFRAGGRRGDREPHVGSASAAGRGLDTNGASTGARAGGHGRNLHRAGAADREAAGSRPPVARTRTPQLGAVDRRQHRRGCRRRSRRARH